MKGRGTASALWVVWRRLTQGQLRERPGQLLVTAFAIALGVALGTAVYLVNGAALNEFGQATKRLVGEADIVVRGPPAGFDEQLFVRLAHDTAVSAVSPVLELQLALPGRRAPLKLLGLDPFRAGALQPVLMGQLGGSIMGLLDPDAVLLSSAAAEQLHLQRGDVLPVAVGSGVRALRVIAVLPVNAYPEPLALMDLASAQWTLARLGRINRIDMRLRAGSDVQRYRAGLAARLPAGVVALAPEVELDRAASATRAYRVNLNMLALVALLTGAFLVFSTQWLAVLRRRSQLALLRALGVTRPELAWALVLEGAAMGAAGSLLGVVLGALVAAAALRYLNAELGAGPLATAGVQLSGAALPLLLFFVLGTAITCLGAWIPAREAARRAPALALKAGDAEVAVGRIATTGPGLILLCGGAGLALLPAIRGLPLPGYASVGCLLLGSILLAPALMRALLRAAPRTGRVVIDTAIAQLKGSAGLSAVSLASILVSFSLMVAMAIMVHSFRDSFDLWLGKLLPADLQMRVPLDSDTAAWSAEDQDAIATLSGVAHASFARTQQIYLRADRPPVTLIARDTQASAMAGTLPLMHAEPPPWPADAPPAWISEALQDLYGYRSGDRIKLPIAGRMQSFFVAGVWRDYVRPGGAIVITRTAYVDASGDRSATEGSVWLGPGAGAASVAAAIRARLRANAAPGGKSAANPGGTVSPGSALDRGVTLGHGDSLEIVTTTEVRERSLLIFDRAFAMTYALEAIAVLIGLVGVGVATSSTALARRAQFGMLRHIGMLRSQVVGMLASEGLFLSGLGVLYGLAVGTALSLVLIYVINRQSFNWSIDLAVPWLQLAIMSVALTVAATVIATWSGRAAMSVDAIRAVREDW